MSIATPNAANTTFGIHSPDFRLPATARIGRVRLAVSRTLEIGAVLLGSDRAGRAGEGRQSRQAWSSKFPTRSS